ncbi:MAG: isocitrate/isopropylmalate dehydrogenase family protein, partial [Oscillospiraceae bacterium]|nr:isocitrate/isopropylmalate dehydrogenase family protein [Oscillospiraceae bacterium]
MEQMEKALAHFQALLDEQFKRLETIEKPKKDFASIETVTIGVCGGDGIGPIITAQAARLLEHLLKDEIAAGKVVIKNIEGLTIENRLATNQAVPADVLAEIKTCDVLLKGPTTTPNGGTMESANVTLRRELDLYANVRPVSIPEQGIDWMFYRENTEG